MGRTIEDVFSKSSRENVVERPEVENMYNV